jgi:hypothetical protein
MACCHRALTAAIAVTGHFFYAIYLPEEVQVGSEPAAVGYILLCCEPFRVICCHVAVSADGEGPLLLGHLPA